MSVIEQVIEGCSSGVGLQSEVRSLGPAKAQRLLEELRAVVHGRQDVGEVGEQEPEAPFA